MNLKFEYVNWRDELHTYVIEPEKIELGPYDATGMHERNPPQWVLHGAVVTRDGDARPDMGTRRRTFLMKGLRNIESVERSR